MPANTLPAAPCGWDLETALTRPAARLPRLRFADGPPGGDAGGGDSGSGDGGDPPGGDSGSSDGGDPPGDDDFKSGHSKRAVLADLKKASDDLAAARKELDDIADKNKSDEQRKAEADKARETEAAKAVRTAQQYEACEKAELPLSWAKRISGDTPEEMNADAQELKKDMDAAAGAGHRTDGAGTAGDKTDPAASALPGANRIAAYYATADKK